MPQNVPSDQGQHCVLTIILMQNRIKMQILTRNPKHRNGLIHIIQMDKSTDQTRVKTVLEVNALLKGENLLHDHMLIMVHIFSIKRNNLRPDKQISYISGLTRPISMP